MVFPLGAFIIFRSSEVGKHGTRVTEVLDGVADVLHFLLQELRTTDSECLEEETNDHVFLCPFAIGRGMVYKIIFICGFYTPENTAPLGLLFLGRGAVHLFLVLR